MSDIIELTDNTWEVKKGRVIVPCESCKIKGTHYYPIKIIRDVEGGEPIKEYLVEELSVVKRDNGHDYMAEMRKYIIQTIVLLAFALGAVYVFEPFDAILLITACTFGTIIDSFTEEIEKVLSRLFYKRKKK